MRRRLLLLLACLPVVAAAPGPGALARKVLAPTGFPGWQTHNVCFPFVVRDPVSGLWRMYYAGSATDQVAPSAWDLWATGVVTSTDLVRWRYPDDYEPVLAGHRFLEGDLVAYGGADRAFDGIAATGAWVLRDGRQWRAWYTGWNGDERSLGGGRVEPVRFRIGYARSHDGLRWTKQPGPAEQGAMLGLGKAGDLDMLAAAHPTVLKVGATYHLWYEAYDGTTWRIAQARSADGRAWTKLGAALEPGAGDSLDALGARHPVARKTATGFELWYQGRSRAEPAFHVLRARSVDGAAWTKVSGEVALHPEPPLSADERLHVGNSLPQPDGTLLVFFAKETAVRRRVTWGTAVARTTAIYAEKVRP
jgi:hypothetical protein